MIGISQPIRMCFHVHNLIKILIIFRIQMGYFAIYFIHQSTEYFFASILIDWNRILTLKQDHLVKQFDPVC